MRQDQQKWLWVILAASLGISASAAEPVLAYTPASSGTRVSVSGTSTMHDWTMVSTEIKGSVSIPPDLFGPGATALPEDALTLSASVPVTSLKSGKDSMDRRAHKALDRKKHPDITYTLNAVSGRRPLTNDFSRGIVVDARGDLSLAGSTNSLNLELTFIPEDGASRITVSGEAELKMTQFGVSPPSVIGLLRTGDAVSVTFEWHVTRPPADPPQTPSTP